MARKRKDALALRGQGTFSFDLPPIDLLRQAGVVTRNDAGYSFALEKLAKCRKGQRVSTDIETFAHGISRGPDKSALKHWQNEIRLIALKLPDGTKICHDYGENHNGSSSVYDDNFQKALNAAVNNGVTIGGHNTYFDSLNIRAKLGIIIDDIDCSMTQSKILWAGVPNYFHDIGSVAIRNGQKLHDKSYGATVDFGGQITDRHRQYNVDDTCLADELIDIQKATLARQELSHIYELERRVIPAFVDMAYNGLPVNTPALERIYDKFYSELIRLERRIKHFARHKTLALDIPDNDIAGLGGNWVGSSRKTYKYLLDILLGDDLRAYEITNSLVGKHEAFGLQPILWADGRPSGEYEPADINIIADFPSASSDALLMKLVEFPGDLQEIAQDILDYRSIRVQLAYLEKINKYTVRGRVRASYTTMAHSGNGRVSIKDPNLANSAKLKTRFKRRGLEPVRLIFQSNDPQEQQMIFDLPGAHGAAAAEVSGDALLCKHVLEDLHSVTASAMAEMLGHREWTPEYISAHRKGGYPDSDECASLRDGAKTLFYCKLNKAGKRQVQYVLLGGDTCIRKTIEEVDLWCKAFDRKFASLVYTQNRIAQLAAEHSVQIGGRNYGTVYSLDGRRIFIPMFGPVVSPSQAVMQMWMSIEARLIKECIAERYHQLQRKHPEYGIKSENMQHDEDDFSAASSYDMEVATKYAEIARKISARYIKKIDLAPKFTADGMLIVKDPITNEKRRITTLNDK